MTKNKIAPGCYVFPVPVVLVGANVNGKANFNAIGWVVGLEFTPPLISVCSNQAHYNNIGIKENKTFSVNTPTVDMVEKTDYCGIKSGKSVDKSEVFDVFYGELKTAPMIKEAALNLECKLIHTVDTKQISDTKMGHDLFIGEVVQVYADEKYLLNGVPDLEKIKPFVLSGSRNRQRYYNIGEELGVAWSIGNNYKKE
ncbi:MAG: flavin reductase family protein [Candidatus Thorarchaeota archaeon]